MTDSQSASLAPRTHLGPVTNFFPLLEIFFRQLRVCYFVAPSLMRGWICNLLYNCFWASRSVVFSEGAWLHLNGYMNILFMNLRLESGVQLPQENN
jgi:hypothetical protein